MKLLWCDPVTRSSKVTVTGFDNHNNRSITREVMISAGNSLNTRTTERLCRHTQNLGGQKVSKCWAGLGCEAATGDAEASYLLFLDTCEEGGGGGGGGRRYCTTQFVRRCPDLGDRGGVGQNYQNNEGTLQIKLPRLINDSINNTNSVTKPVKILTLGLKRNTLGGIRDRKISDNGNLEINPNIVVNYLNKKQHRFVDSNLVKTNIFSEKQPVPVTGNPTEPGGGGLPVTSNPTEPGGGGVPVTSNPMEPRIITNLQDNIHDDGVGIVLEHSNIINEMHHTALDKVDDIPTETRIPIQHKKEDLVTLFQKVSKKNTAEIEISENQTATGIDIDHTRGDSVTEMYDTKTTDALLKEVIDNPTHTESAIKYTIGDLVTKIQDGIKTSEAVQKEIDENPPETGIAPLLTEIDDTTITIDHKKESINSLDISDLITVRLDKDELKLCKEDVSTSKTNMIEVFEISVLSLMDLPETTSQGKVATETNWMEEDFDIVEVKEIQIELKDTNNHSKDTHNRVFDEKSDNVLNQETVALQAVEDFQFPEEVILNTINYFSSGKKELIDLDGNENIHDTSNVAKNTEPNINYILDVLKGIKVSNDNTSLEVYDINEEYNVRKMFEDSIDNNNVDEEILVESDLEEFLGLDIEYENRPKKETSMNDNNEVATTADMYAGDVDILFGL